MPFVGSLPPANVVCEVMFIHLSVSHSADKGVSVQACTTGHMTGGSLRGSLCRGVSVQGGLCLGGSVSLLGRPLSYSNERAVRILLECLLVTLFFFKSMLVYWSLQLFISPVFDFLSL